MEVDRLIDHHPLRRCQYLDRLRGRHKFKPGIVAQLCHGLLAAYSRYHDYKSRHGVIMLWRSCFAPTPKLWQVWAPNGCSFKTEAGPSIPLQSWLAPGEPEEVPYGLIINATRREVKELRGLQLYTLANLLQAAGEVCSKLARYVGFGALTLYARNLLSSLRRKGSGRQVPSPTPLTDTVGEERYLALVKPAAEKMLLRAPKFPSTLGALPHGPLLSFGVLASQQPTNFPVLPGSAAKTRRDVSTFFQRCCGKMAKALSTKVASWEHRASPPKRRGPGASLALPKETHEQALGPMRELGSDGLYQGGPGPKTRRGQNPPSAVVNACVPTFSIAERIQAGPTAAGSVALEVHPLLERSNYYNLSVYSTVKASQTTHLPSERPCPVSFPTRRATGCSGLETIGSGFGDLNDGLRAAFSESQPLRGRQFAGFWVEFNRQLEGVAASEAAVFRTHAGWGVCHPVGPCQLYPSGPPFGSPPDGSFMWVTLVGQAQLVLAAGRGPWWDAALKMPCRLYQPRKGCHHVNDDGHGFPTTLGPPQDDIAVWRTPPGMLCHEVLKRGHPAVEDRNPRGRPREVGREIREQLAAKEGHRPKVKGGAKPVDSQLAQKKRRCATTSKATSNLETGLKLAGIHELPPACGGPLAHLLVRMFSVVGTRTRRAKVGGERGLDRPAGVATLRSYDLAVPNEWQGEPLGELLTRLLFRLQMLTSRKPLDPPPSPTSSAARSHPPHRGSSATVKVRDAGHDDDQPSLQIEQVRNHAPLWGTRPCRAAVAGGPVARYKAQLELRPPPSLSDGLGGADGNAVVFIGGLLDESPFVRKACLRASTLWTWPGAPNGSTYGPCASRPGPSERQLGAALWEDNALEVPVFCSAICGLLTHPLDPIRTCANSFHDAILIHPDALPRVLDAFVPTPFDQRISVGLALGGIIPLAHRRFSKDSSTSCSPQKPWPTPMPVSARRCSKGPFDYIREGAVILYGTLARNLADGAERAEIVAKLIQTLDTPPGCAVCGGGMLAAPHPRRPRNRPRSGPIPLIGASTAARLPRRGAAFGLAGGEGDGLDGLEGV
ncbi:translational activator of GCN4 [Massospora cicadina]|nr:translational activator of GCN4 [Massospora cicadina]